MSPMLQTTNVWLGAAILVGQAYGNSRRSRQYAFAIAARRSAF
jgi:hypothetical protein